MRIIDRVLISIYNFFHHQCEGCIARAYEIARLNHANEEMRHQLNEVIDNQKVMLRDILKLNQSHKQNLTGEVNSLPMRKLSTIQNRINEAEKRDLEEYNKRIAEEMDKND